MEILFLSLKHLLRALIMSPSKLKPTKAPVAFSHTNLVVAIFESPAECWSMSLQTAMEEGRNAGPSGADILASITTCKETRTAKLEEIGKNPDKFRTRLTEAKGHISHVEDIIKTGSTEPQVKALQDKSVDTEHRLRCNNLPVLTIPKKAGGTHTS